MNKTDEVSAPNRIDFVMGGRVRGQLASMRVQFKPQNMYEGIRAE